MEKQWEILGLFYTERHLSAGDFILGNDQTIIEVIAGEKEKFEFLVYHRTRGDFINKVQELSQAVSVPSSIVKPTKEFLKKLKAARQEASK